jgi:hypothetical protein
VQERIASQDELPTPEESRAATWGDNPQYYDETDLATEYDGDASTYHSWEDDLPTPEESRAATWGDNPQYYDETDLATEYDGDLDALTASEPGTSGDTEAVSAETRNPEESPDPTADTSDVNQDPAADRIPAANERIAELEARLERLEHASQPMSDGPLLSNERDVDKIPGQTTERQHRWRMSDARLGLGSAIVGSGLSEAADFIVGGPEHYAFGVVGSVISIGVAAIAASRESRKDKHVRTPER